MTGSRCVAAMALPLLQACALPPGSFESSGAAETYGPDDRREIWSPANSAEAVAWSSTTAAFIPWEYLDEAGPALFRVRAPTLRERYSVCGFEPFRNQPSAAHCSGFLAGADVVVTAGHCYKAETACDDLAIVFGFAWEAAGDDPTLVPATDVFSCREVIARHQTKLRRDYAVVQLDRPVPDRTPLPLESERRVEVGDELTLIGSPAGVPLKIDEGLVVHEAAEELAYFITTGDTYARNSGSPVIREGRVVGIHVAGASDYMKHPSGCFYSRACVEIGSQSGCPGSRELHVSSFADDVPPPEVEPPPAETEPPIPPEGP